MSSGLSVLLSAMVVASGPPARLDHAGPVYAIAFTPDGRFLLTGSADGLVRVWDVATGKERSRFQAHEKGVLALALTADGKTLATGGRDGVIRIRDLRTTREIAKLEGVGGAVDSLALSPDGRRVVASSSGRNEGSRVVIGGGVFT